MTLPYGVRPILKYIPKNAIVWCPFDTEDSEFVKQIRASGNKVVATHISNGQDFYTYEPTEHWDCIVSNPPFSNKRKTFERALSFNKPFALIDRGYGKGGIDFLKWDKPFDGDIITNPPYKYASAFVEKALETVTDGHKAAMFLKIQFLEGKARGELFKKYPPKTVWVSRSRLLCAKNGEFEKMKAGGGSAVAYAWYIWEKGYQGKTTLDWFN